MKENNFLNLQIPLKLAFLLLSVFCVNSAIQTVIFFFMKIDYGLTEIFFWHIMPLYYILFFYCCHKEKLKISPYILLCAITVGCICYCWYSIQLLDISYVCDAIFFDAVICGGVFFYFLFFHIFSYQKHFRMLFLVKCSGALFALLPLICFCSFDFEKLQIVIFMNNYSLSALIANSEILHIIRRFLLQSAFVLVCAAAIVPALPPIPASGRLKKFCFAGMILSAFFFIPMCIGSLPRWNQLNVNDDITFFRQAIIQRKNPLYISKTKLDSDIMPGMYFLIVGESHNYQHPVLPYKGYLRLTDKISKDNNFIIFPDAHCLPIQGTEVYTGDSEYEILNMLSLSRTPVSIIQLLTTPTLLDFCHYNRLKTVWYSNLGCYVPFAQMQKYFSDSCDTAIVTDSNSYNGKYAGKGLQVDSEIVPRLKELYSQGVLDKNGSFMLIQPMGIHVDQLQTPKEFQEKFSAYTNDKRHLAELYYDRILEEIVTTLTAFPETRAIVYVSDHTWERNESDSHITMFVYLSPELQRRNPSLLLQMKQYAGRNFTNSEICELYLKILNIKMVGKNELVGK